MRRLIAFSQSWGSLSPLAMGSHPTRKGAICSGAMLPVPAAPAALPSPPRRCLLQLPSEQSQQVGHIKNLLQNEFVSPKQVAKALVHFLPVSPAEDACLLSLLNELWLIGTAIGAWHTRGSPREAGRGMAAWGGLQWWEPLRKPHERAKARRREAGTSGCFWL